MDKLIFTLAMLLYGFISRINFIMRYGPSLDIDISRVESEDKYLQSKLSVITFFLYMSIIIWGFIYLFWGLALSIMLAGLFIGGLMVNNTDFSRFVAIKPKLEFSIIIISLYLWMESILLFF